MGIDTDVILPANVRIRDVALVLARLHGYALAGSEYGWMLPDDVKVAPTLTPEMARIHGPDFHYWFHFEYSERPGCKLLSCRLSDHSPAIAHALVDFFGGTAIANDCDEEVTHRRAAKGNQLNHPVNDAPWKNLQDRIGQVTPIVRR